MIDYPKDWPLPKQHELCRALFQVNRLDEFSIIVKFLKDQLERNDIANRHESDNIGFIRRQGCSKTLEKLIDLFETADKHEKVLRSEGSQPISRLDKTPEIWGKTTTGRY